MDLVLDLRLTLLCVGVLDIDMDAGCGGEVVDDDEVGIVYDMGLCVSIYTVGRCINKAPCRGYPLVDSTRYFW